MGVFLSIRLSPLMSVHNSLLSQVRYSAGRGHGLFAAEDVPRGGLVAEYVGEVITYDEWARYVGWLVGWLVDGKFVDVCSCSCSMHNFYHLLVAIACSQPPAPLFASIIPYRHILRLKFLSSRDL